MEPKVFRYSSQSGNYVGLIAALGSMALLETSVIALVITLVAQDPTIKIALLVALVLLLCFTFALVLAPLSTKHRINATHVQLRYGFQFSADLPRSALLAAQPLDMKPGTWGTGGVRYEAEQNQIVAALSEHGLVLLTLDQARSFRVGLFGRATAARILVNVDDRDGFLSELALPRIPEPATPPAIQVTEPSRAPLTPIRWTEIAIRTDKLTRKYRDLTAVDALDLAIGKGEIYGFLGPNGAGKTTTIKMLVGLLEPTSGSAFIAGHDVWKEPLQAKTCFGFVADRAILYERLTGTEFLEFLAQMRGIPLAVADERIVSLLNLLELKEQANNLTGAYSFGMKRKLALAGALLHEPPILILDEPLTGLDPLSARRIKDLFADLAARGTTIFLSTHDLATAETVCHRVGILHRGHLLVEGSAKELRLAASAPDLEAVFLDLVARSPESAP